MSTTPTKLTANSPLGWRRVTDKINVLTMSSKANDPPTPSVETYTHPYECQPEIKEILDFRNTITGLEYNVLWNSNDMKPSWETELVLESICKEALVKFWVKTTLTTAPLPEGDSVEAVFMKKLKSWSLSSSSLLITPKKELAPISPLSQAKKRPRLEAFSERDQKPKLFNLIGLKELSDEHFSKLTKAKFPDQLQGILEPEEFTQLVEKRNYEIGELIPINYDDPMDEQQVFADVKNGPYAVMWSYLSLETPETLGLTDEQCKQYCKLREITRLGRKKGEVVSSIRKIEQKSLDEIGEIRSNDFMKRKSSDSDSSSASTDPPSPTSDSGESEASTHPPSESMDCEEEPTQVLPTNLLVNSGAQTDELDPFTCTYCHAKKGELLRLSALRNRQEIKKQEAKVASSNSKDKNSKADQHEEQEEDEDMVSIEYEIDKILDYRKQEGTNIDEYYIRWKNYTADYDTWEPDSNLGCCDKALIQFYVNQAFKRRNEEQKLIKQGTNNGALVPVAGNGTAGTSSSGSKKKISLPALPPIPEIILEILNGVIPISDGEVEMAYKLTKTVKKKSRLAKSKLERIMLNLIEKGGNAVAIRAAAQAELPVLRHEILMIEAERRKDLALRDLKEWERQLNMIAKRKPEIVVENNYDLAGPPEGFRYINDNLLGEGVNFPDDPLEGCDCEDSCGKDKKQCCPGKHDKVLAYNNFKRLRVLPGYPIYECNRRCKCGPECLNRVVQDGTTNLAGTKLCIFRTNNDRGWGVKTLKKIKRGTFVCLYAGEIITSEEAEKRGQVYEKELGASYLFDLDYYADDDDVCPYTIDATKMGNISHFINHSCEPNLCVFNVWADCVDQNLPKLAFFALRDIYRDEELTYDYGTHDDPANSAPALAPFAPRDDVTEPKNPIIKEMDEETDSDTATDNGLLFLNSSPVKNRMKPATTSMSAVRRPCLCGAKTCRKVLF